MFIFKSKMIFLWYQDLLALHDKYSSMITNNFSGHGAFQKSLTDSFTDIVNRELQVVCYDPFKCNSPLLLIFCFRGAK